MPKLFAVLFFILPLVCFAQSNCTVGILEENYFSQTRLYKNLEKMLIEKNISLETVGSDYSRSYNCPTKNCPLKETDLYLSLSRDFLKRGDDSEKYNEVLTLQSKYHLNLDKVIVSTVTAKPYYQNQYVDGLPGLWGFFYDLNLDIKNMFRGQKVKIKKLNLMYLADRIENECANESQKRSN